MGAPPIDCRAAAAKCLALVEGGMSLSQALPRFEDRVKDRDRSLYRQLCYGTLRLFPRLAGCLDPLLSKPLKSKDRDVYMLMILGIYQLADMRIPDHAAVNATVAASRGLKKPWSKNLVNAVLRNWQRQHQQLLESLSPAQVAAHPDWLHQSLHRAWPDAADTIEQANNAQAPMCLRVNRQRQPRVDYLQRLQQAGLDAVACEFSVDGLRLLQAVDVNELPGFVDGCVSVQDEAAQLSAHLLQLQPGQRVLDACCAPGGKTSHCLELEPGLAELVALDIDEQRLQRVEDNLQRLSLAAKLVCADASTVDDWWDGRSFDRILLDAPCSATGVIRRNPDIKLHRRNADIDNLSRHQLQMLMSLWPTLAAGGLLLYATCSVLPEENEAVVARFLEHQEDAQHLEIFATWGSPRPCGRQLFPQQRGHDGFFYALLRKK